MGWNSRFWGIERRIQFWSQMFKTKGNKWVRNLSVKKEYAMPTLNSFKRSGSSKPSGVPYYWFYRIKSREKGQKSHIYEQSNSRAELSVWAIFFNKKKGIFKAKTITSIVIIPLGRKRKFLHHLKRLGFELFSATTFRWDSQKKVTDDWFYSCNVTKRLWNARTTYKLCQIEILAYSHYSVIL